MDWKYYTNRSSPKILDMLLHILSLKTYHNPRELLTIGLGQSTFDFLLGGYKLKRTGRLEMLLFSGKPLCSSRSKNATLAAYPEVHWIIINSVLDPLNKKMVHLIKMEF